MSKEIHKKTHIELFNEVKIGQKTFDVRLADWQCEPGDILVLDEYDQYNNRFTGNSIRKKVGYVLKTSETKFFSDEDIEKYGLQVISLLEENK